MRAFYAYLCRRCLLGGPEPEDPITQNMLYLVTDSSLYCRENSLSALYAFGGTEAVAQALVRLSRAGVLHSAKLITDGLLSFHGNRRQLSDVLWGRWEEFLPYYQTAIVNYLRMSDSRFCDRLLLLLKEEEEDRELRLAIVRYYRKTGMSPPGKRCRSWCAPPLRRVGSLRLWRPCPWNATRGTIRKRF